MKKIEKINRTNQIIMRMSIAAKALNSTHNTDKFTFNSWYN